MATFDYKLEAYIGRRPIHPTEIIVEWDETTPTITYWNEASLGKAKPTDEQLNALESQATTLENNSIAIYNRLKEYPSLGDVVDAIFKKEAGDSTEFDALATKRTTIKNKYTKG